MAAVENSVGNNNIKSDKTSSFQKPLWSDSEDEGDTEPVKKTEKSTTELEVQTQANTPKEKDDKSLLGSEFDSKWDRFPTSQEFKSLYGEEIWDQLQNSYNDLAKSVTDIATGDQEYIQPKKDKEKRTTCWDALDAKVGEGDTSTSTINSKDSQEPSEKKRMGRPPGIKNGDRSNKGPGRVQCHLCENKFDSLAQARAHLQVHSGVKPYKCSKCDYRSYSKFNVTNNHWSNKHGRKGQNEDVEALEVEKEKLRLFVLREAEKMLPITDKRPNEEANNDDKEEKIEKKRPKQDPSLKPERKNHKVSGQLNCNKCDKTFETMVLVRGHLQVHADIRPYKCSKCDYRSYSKNNVINNHYSNNHGRKANDDEVEADMDEKLNLKRFVIEESEKIYNQMMEDKKQVMEDKKQVMDDKKQEETKQGENNNNEKNETSNEELKKDEEESSNEQKSSDSNPATQEEENSKEEETIKSNDPTEKKESE